jgi:hypothetical protein
MEVQKPSIVMVPLNEEPLLSFRDRILRDHDLQQRLVLYRRPKQKATERNDRTKDKKDDYEAARIKKQTKGGSVTSLCGPIINPRNFTG